MNSEHLNLQFTSLFLWTKGTDVLCCIPSWLKKVWNAARSTFIDTFYLFFSSLKPWHYTFVPPIKFYLLIWTFLVLINSTVFCPHRSKSWLTYDLHKRHPIYSNIFFEFKEFQNVCYFTHYHFVLLIGAKAQIQIKLVENLCMLQKFHLKRFFLDVINTIVKNAINRSKEQILMMTKKFPILIAK